MKNNIDFQSQYSSNSDPWGMTRASQQIRNENYVNNLKEFFGNKNFENAIDLACGDGVLIKMLSPFFKDVTLCDAYNEMLEISKSNFKTNTHTIQNVLPNIPSKDTYDLIFSIEVLNYLSSEDFLLYFQNVKQIMNKKSYLIISIEEKKINSFNENFNIIKIFKRYISPYMLTDKLYFLVKDLEKAKELIKNSEKSYPDVSEKKQQFIKNNRKYLKLFLFIIPGLEIILKKIYTSYYFEKLLYGIGKFLKIEHKRSLVILQKK